MQKTSSVIIWKSKAEAKKLLETYNLSELTRFARYPERCVLGNAPTLAMVSRDYGEQVAVDWLRIELDNYQDSVGVKEDNKADMLLMKETAQEIMHRYYFLKLSELMLFFNRLRFGDYGKVYGCVDVSFIVQSLRSFMGERAVILDRERQRHEEQQRKEDRKNAISYEEHLRMKEREKRGL